VIRLEAEKITKKYGKKVLFRDLDFAVSTGESVCIWGHNGSGKSTMLKVLAGLIRPSAGTVSFIEDSKKQKPHTAINLFGIVSPDVIPYDELTPMENIAFVAKMRQIEFDAKTARARLEALGLTHSFDNPAGTMSSGMKQRLKIVLGTLHDPKVLFLDEPSSYLDMDGAGRIEDYVRNIMPGIALVVATNNPAERQWCGRTIELGV